MQLAGFKWEKKFSFQAPVLITVFCDPFGDKISATPSF
jgi:hypothetical protein